MRYKTVIHVVSADNGMTHLKLISIFHIHCRLCIRVQNFEGYRMSFIYSNFILWLLGRVTVLLSCITQNFPQTAYFSTSKKAVAGSSETSVPFVKLHDVTRQT